MAKVSYAFAGGVEGGPVGVAGAGRAHAFRRRVGQGYGERARVLSLWLAAGGHAQGSGRVLAAWRIISARRAWCWTWAATWCRQSRHYPVRGGATALGASWAARCRRTIASRGSGSTSPPETCTTWGQDGMTLRQALGLRLIAWCQIWANHKTSTGMLSPGGTLSGMSTPRVTLQFRRLHRLVHCGTREMRSQIRGGHVRAITGLSICWSTCCVFRFA